MQDTVVIDRHKYIGGSDIPIIMGLSPFKTRWQLLQEKAQLVESDFMGNEYTEYGNTMEAKIRDFVNEKYSKSFKEHKLTKGVFRCHTDGFDPKAKMILEIKTTSQIHSDIDGYKVYLVQLLHYMMCYGIDCGMLAVYERPENFDETFDFKKLTVYSVNTADYSNLCKEIEAQVDRFLGDLEKLKENPFLTEEEMQPFELVALSSQIVTLEQQLLEYKRIEEEAKKVKADLKAAMQQYGVKKWTTNNGVKITLIEDGNDTTVKAFDEKRFKEEQPALYAAYEVDKVKKGKTGYLRITL